jgi:hypothetical protein
VVNQVGTKPLVKDLVISTLSKRVYNQIEGSNLPTGKPVGWVKDMEYGSYDNEVIIWCDGQRLFRLRMNRGTRQAADSLGLEWNTSTKYKDLVEEIKGIIPQLFVV